MKRELIPPIAMYFALGVYAFSLFFALVALLPMTTAETVYVSYIGAANLLMGVVLTLYASQ